MKRLKNMTGQGWTITARIHGEDVTRTISAGGSLDVDSYDQVVKTLIANRKFKETEIPDPAVVAVEVPAPAKSGKKSSPEV